MFSQEKSLFTKEQTVSIKKETIPEVKASEVVLFRKEEAKEA